MNQRRNLALVAAGYSDISVVVHECALGGGTCGVKGVSYFSPMVAGRQLYSGENVLHCKRRSRNESDRNIRIVSILT